MTIWTPDLTSSSGPRYQAIADAIGSDLASGELLPGQQLPTHRALADQLGVTIQTISRGYAEAKRRGLVTGEVGRGTFVRTMAPPEQRLAHENEDPEATDLSANAPSLAATAHQLMPALNSLSAGNDLASVLEYQPRPGRADHRRAGAQWLARSGIAVDPEHVVVTAGAQHALALSFSVATQPGDVVLTESLTYPGIKALARFLNLSLVGVPTDQDGICPDALRQACQKHQPAGIYCVPTLQNPTATIMPESRRKEIADISDNFGVPLIEDDIYRFLIASAPPPISSFCKTESFYLTSLSKDIAPGLRIGYLKASPDRIEQLCAAMMATTLMASPLCAEIATRLIDDGTAEQIVDYRRAEVRARQTIARRVLGDRIDATCRPESFHLWLQLPEPWRSEEFCAKARSNKILISSSETFVVGRSAAPHAVRISLAAVRDNNALEDALKKIAELLDRPPAPVLSGL